MREIDRKIIAQCKQKIAERLEKPKGIEVGHEPVFQGSNIRYEMSARTSAVGCGGIGAIHTMVRKLGLTNAIDRAIPLLKVHAPYFESDHVLNLAYNVMTGGRTLDDIDCLRNDETYLNALGARRIPDPTTAGDFLRRFHEPGLLSLMEAVNCKRQRVWDEAARRDPHFFDQAMVDADGTTGQTLGECKEGMDMSHKGIWGYHPAIVSLAQTKEPLFIINRPGNAASHEGVAEYIDRALDLLRGRFKKVLLRGDTDFSQTKHLDKWDEEAQFIFGYDACPNLKAIAQSLDQSAWKPLERLPKYFPHGPLRHRPDNVKERIIRERGYTNLRLQSEDTAEFEYQPTACRKAYRMVVLRKNISIEKGEATFLPDVRYFFYITNIHDWTRAGIVYSANERCDQENLIAQLKGGINALHAPVGDLVSNWAYMIIASLAWTFKSWYALLIERRLERRLTLRMEFRRFLLNFIQLPCQIVRTSRQLVYRVLGYKDTLEVFFETFDTIHALRFG